MPGKRKDPDAEARLAELLEGAKDVEHKSRHARIAYMVGLGDAWIPGRVVPALARIWGLSPVTLSHDASAAYAVLKAQGPDGMAEAATHAALERLHDRLELVSKLAARLRDTLEKRNPKPGDLRDLANALSSIEATIDRTVEWLGKVGKLTTDAPTVQVTIAGGQRERVSVEVIADMPAQLFEMLERVVEAHPEHAAVLPLLADEIRARFASREAAPALPR